MGKEINVSSFSEMGSTAEKLATMSAEYKELSNNLMRRTQTMGDAWKGADNQAFVQQISEFSTKLDMMAKQLQTDSETLKQQKQNYEARQGDNIGQVSKLTN